MRLPFMQLESDLVAHGAALVGQLAGCLPAQALGHIAMLRAWAVSQANDETPPDGLVRGDAAPRLIEAAAQWQGPRGTLFDALLDAGQVQRESEGVRVLHLAPYAKAWERNAKAKARMANGRERSANKPVTAGERPAKFMGQTQTQMEDVEETTISPAPADAVLDGVDDLPDATDDAVPDERPLLTLAYAEPDKPEPKPRPEKPKGLPPEALQEAWNRVAVPLGYQRWEAMSPTRSKAARLALEACPDVARWEAWLAHELARPFNRGDNGSGWKADVDWLLRAKTRDMVRDFNPTAALPFAKTASGGDVPRLGPNPVTVTRPPAGDVPRL